MNLDENPNEKYKENHGQSIPPREEEPRNPRLAEEEYEDPDPNREPHSLKRRRKGPEEQELREFEEAFESFRNHEGNGYFGEIECLLGLYEDEARLWKEQQEQFPIDT